ncbi:MAG: metallophosphoesterase [Petrimonas sp.]|nr:metallophosphoesterase [Petrimonas sp.]
MKIGFFIFLLLILLVGVGYVTIRGVQAFSVYPALRNTYWITLAAMFAMLLMNFFSPFALPAGVAKAVSFLGYSFLILVLYLFIAFLLTDIVRLVNLFAHFITDMPRFRFLAATVSIGLIVLLMAFGNYRFNHPETIRLDIGAKNSSQQKRIKIVAVSDVHLGVSIDKKRLQKFVDRINSEKPDLVLIAGDLIDRSIKPVVESAMEEELTQIDAPMGVYAIFGNHEYYGEGGKAVFDFYKKSHITLLRDSAILVNNDFYIIGRDDATNRHRKSLNSIVSGLDSDKPRILLDHQPLHLQDAQRNQIDLQLSGHTHNGQIFPGNLLVKRIFELPYGYLQKGDTHYYTSSGLGIWGPHYRIGSRSEMVVIDFSY